jgi:hypothetical protein
MNWYNIRRFPCKGNAPVLKDLLKIIFSAKTRESAEGQPDQLSFFRAIRRHVVLWGGQRQTNRCSLGPSPSYRSVGKKMCNLPEGMVHCLGISRRAIFVLGGSFSTKIGRHGFG